MFYNVDIIQVKRKHHNSVVTIIVRDMNANDYENENRSFLTKLFEK